MKKRLLLIACLVLLFVLVISSGAYIGLLRGEINRLQGQVPASLETEQEGMLVTAVPAKAELWRESITYHAIVEPNRQVAVIPKIPGKVQQVDFAVGDRVQKGDFLFSVSADELQVQLKQAEAAVALAEATFAKVLKGARPEERTQAQAMLDQATVAFETAELAYQRSQILHAEKVISNQELDRIKTQYEGAKSQMIAAKQQLAMIDEGAKEEDIQAAKAQLAQAEAALELVRLNLADTQVYAPIGGVVAHRAVEVGAMASNTSMACVIVDIDQVKVQVGLVEGDMVKVTLDMPVEVTVDSIPGEVFHGRIESISPVADPQTRLFSVTAVLPNEANQLRPGMYAKVHIICDQSEELTIPSKALFEDDHGHYVWTIHQGACQKRRIQIGLERNRRIQVCSGLVEDEIIITRSEGVLTEGKAVLVTEHFGEE